MIGPYSARMKNLLVEMDNNRDVSLINKTLDPNCEMHGIYQLVPEFKNIENINGILPPII